MTSVPASPYASKDRIEQWREETSSAPKRYHGIIARISNTCLSLLRILIQHCSPPLVFAPDKRTLRQCYSMLQIWDHDHGVAEGRLDDRLERSTEVSQATVEVLIHLLGCLLDGTTKFVLSQVKDESIIRQHTLASDLYSQRGWFSKSDESSGESEDDGDDDNVDEDDPSTPTHAMARRVKTYTNCIMGLGATLDCPAPDDIHDYKPGITGVVSRSAHDYHTDLIQAKYPSANIKLLKILGGISWSRFLRMQRERDHNTDTSATKSIGPVTEFQDSGMGTSLPTTQSSYAESTVSFMASISGGERVRIPPLPSEGKEGLSFECIACGKHVRATDNREWRKHLYNDLQPYTCLFHTCEFNTKPFPSRQVWADHLELEHNFGPTWREVQCPLCSSTTGAGKNKVLAHFARHMEDIALIALPPTVESDDDSDASVQSSLPTIGNRSVSTDEFTNLINTRLPYSQFGIGNDEPIPIPGSQEDPVLRPENDAPSPDNLEPASATESRIGHNIYENVWQVLENVGEVQGGFSIPLESASGTQEMYREQEDFDMGQTEHSAKADNDKRFPHGDDYREAREKERAERAKEALKFHNDSDFRSELSRYEARVKERAARYEAARAEMLYGSTRDVSTNISSESPKTSLTEGGASGTAKKADSAQPTLNALQAAAESGQDETVKLLPEHDVHSNELGESHGNCRDTSSANMPPVRIDENDTTREQITSTNGWINYKPAASTRKVHVWRWICCNCQSDNSCRVDAGCPSCANHFRDGHCSVYDASRR